MNTASWVFGPGREEQAKEIFLTAIRLAAGDAESAKAEAREYKTLEHWRRQLRRRVGVAAGGTALIPGLHGGGIALEIPYLFRLMGRGAIGTGGLMGAEIEPEADLLAIFALWSGAINEAALLAAVGGVVVVDSVVYPAFGAKALAIGLKLTAGTVIAHAGIGGVGGMAIGKATGVVTQMLQPVFSHFLAAISATDLRQDRRQDRRRSRSPAGSRCRRRHQRVHPDRVPHCGQDLLRIQAQGLRRITGVDGLTV